MEQPDCPSCVVVLAPKDLESMKFIFNGLQSAAWSPNLTFKAETVFRPAHKKTRGDQGHVAPYCCMG